MVKHYLWLSAITSKVTRFITIKIIHILVFLIVVFPTLVLMSTVIFFYSFFTIFGIFSLALFIFRVICFLHLSLIYESLVYRLLSVRSIFFKLNMTSNIIKCLHVVNIGKVNTHVFPIAWQRTGHNLELLFINHLMSNTL